MPDNRHASPQRPDNHVIVLFGATGDLARRKLLPGLFHQFRRDRTAMGDLRAAAGEPAAGSALRPRIVGPAVGRPADRPAPLAPA